MPCNSIFGSIKYETYSTSDTLFGSVNETIFTLSGIISKMKMIHEITKFSRLFILICDSFFVLLI